MTMGSEQSPPTDSQSLADTIQQLARDGNFAKADALREELVRSHPAAIGLIVATGEFIEEEKTKRLDPQHLERWGLLYDDLSEEETNCLFYCLKEDRIPPDKMLFLQGKVNNRLFFVEAGEIVLFYRKDERNVVITTVEQGAILGEDTVFGISFCTFSAATRSTVQLRHLSRADIAGWPDQQPGLYNKLRDFCRRSGVAEAAIKKKNLDRRRFPRYPLTAVATAVILDTSGNRTDSYFKGAVVDLSRSGICFSMKCSKQETARALLGRQVDLQVVQGENDSETYRFRGTIVKASFLLLNDYHVHLKFTDVLDEAAFLQIPCDRSAPA